MISRSKIKCMEWLFSGSQSANVDRVTLQNEELRRSGCFKYLGWIVSKDGEIYGVCDTEYTLDESKWWSALGVLCDPTSHVMLHGVLGYQETTCK